MNFPCDCGSRLGSRRDSGSPKSPGDMGGPPGPPGALGAQQERLRGLGCAIDVYFVG